MLLLLPSTGNAFTDADFTHAWALEEASGVRYDDVGTFDLTEYNSVTSGTGKNGDAARFTETNSEYLRYADLAFDCSADWSLSFWFKLADMPASSDSEGFFTTDSAGNGCFASVRIYNNAGTLLMRAYIQDSAGNHTLDINPWSYDTTWHHMVVSYAFDDTFAFYADGSLASSTTSGHEVSRLQGDLTFLGCEANAATGLCYSGRYLDGYLDEVYLFDIALASSSVTALYNAGSGSFYPFSTTSSSTASSTASVDVTVLTYTIMLFFSLFTLMLFTVIGYKFTKLFI